MPRIQVGGVRYSVSTTPTEILRIPVESIRAILIRNEEAAGGPVLYVGTRGVSATTGFSLQAGEAIGLSHMDFIPRVDQGELVLYGVSTAPCAVSVLTVRV